MTVHRRLLPEVPGQRIHDRRCPHCNSFKAMPNPVEHTQDERPYLCLVCEQSFASNETETE